MKKNYKTFYSDDGRVEAYLEVASSHTPGPWIVDEYTIVAGGLSVCQVPDPKDFSGLSAKQIKSISATSLANARLIAAAPELLTALKRIAYDPQGPIDATHGEVLDRVVDIAIAAIAKAEGRSA